MKKYSKSRAGLFLFTVIFFLLTFFAFRHFTQNTASHPTQALYEAKLGDRYAAKEDWKNAAQHYQMSLSLYKERDIEFLLAVSYIKSQRKDLAIPLLQELSTGTDDNATMAKIYLSPDQGGTRNRAP